MCKKVKKWSLSHPMGVLSIILLFAMALSLVLSIVPEWIIYLLGGVFIIFVIWSLCKEKKEKNVLQNMTQLDMKEKWKKYVDIVNSTLQNQNKTKILDDSWIEIFHYLMHHIATNSYYIRRKLNDFDIASFLIYSLTWKHREKEDILFAFECAKKIMSNPKVYYRHVNLGGELSLEVEGPIPEIENNPFNENIPEEKIISIIKRYLNQKSYSAIVQLSDFLYTLYKKS